MTNFVDKCNQILLERCKESERYTHQLSSRLEEEMQHIRVQELSPYYLALRKKGEKVDTDRHAVAYLLGLADSFSGDKPPMMGDAPDVDVDFSNRQVVVQYLKEKYGEDHVAYISNYTRLSDKSAIADVCRVSQISVSPKIKDTVEGLGSVQKFLDMNPKNIDEKTMAVLEIAANLEGNVRQMSISAAGVVVSKDPITDYAALYKNKNNEIVLVNDKVDAEDIGFVKMDILYTQNVEAMQRCMELIEESGGTSPEDVWNLPLDDKKMIKEFAKGHTDLIFQYGGYALKSTCVQMKPKNVEDLIAANALCRKGADDQAYIRRKEGKEEVDYYHDSLEPILEDTYGIMVYQEQVMAICRQLAGMSWQDVNRVRKMVGKKTYKDEPELKKLFMMGCKKNGVAEETSNRIWGDIKKHGEYSFNRAHCVAYFMQAWANMYFQVYHSFEWYLANLQLEDKDEKTSVIIANAQREGIEFTNVDVNKSKANWSRDGDKFVPALSNIKGLGPKVAEKIQREAERSPYIGWRDRITNKKQDERMYYLVQETPSGEYDEKEEYLGWVSVPKNVFFSLRDAGAIPEIEGKEVQSNLAAGMSVDVIADREIHKFWNPIPMSQKPDGPCVIHGYVKGSTKKGGSQELNIQSDIPGVLWYEYKLEPGSYLLVTDGKFDRVYMAIPEEKWTKHPMARHYKDALGDTKKGLAFYTGNVKVNDKQGNQKYVSMFLAPQPRLLWFNQPLEERGVYALTFNKDQRIWMSLKI